MTIASIAAAICVAMLAALAPAAFPAAKPSATRILRYDPFDASGSVRASVEVGVRRGGASCWSGGLPGRRDAWRCRARNSIFDPCFESRTRDIALCPLAPGARAVLLVHPAFDREYQNIGSRRWFWAIRTRTDTCVASSGARGKIRGRYPTFFCDRGKRAVWGKIDRRRPAWRALVGSYEEPRGWRWQTVTRAWK